MTDHLTEFALPGVIGEIARLTSVETAIGVAREVGGTEIYIPKKLPPRHRLIELVGQYCAQILCQKHGGSHLPFPSAKTAIRWFDARRLRRNGKTVPFIAKKLGIGTRRVEQLLEGIDLSGGDETEEEVFKIKACHVCGRRNCRPKVHPHSDGSQGDLFSEV